MEKEGEDGTEEEGRGGEDEEGGVGVGIFWIVQVKIELKLP